MKVEVWVTFPWCRLGNILSILDQSPLESFGSVGLWAWFCQASFGSKGAFQSSHHHSLAS
jgi:hypothetical protein